jgi:uncharacterized membrane protein
MALIKIKTGGLTADSVDNTILDLTDDFAFTGTVSGAGKVLQVVSATETAASSFSNSGTFADVSGLTLNITPASTSSKIMLIASVAASVQNTNADGLVLQFTGGNSTNYIGDTAGSRISGASRKEFFLVTLAALAVASSASSAFIYTTSSASSKGWRISRTLSLKIALALSRSSEITFPERDQAPRKLRSEGTVTLAALA